MPIREQFPDDKSFLQALRDWFAGQALPACILCCHASERLDGETFAQMFARKADEAADAMIARRRASLRAKGEA